MAKPSLDDIDRQILQILAKNPRTPYSDIADQLTDMGYDMSGEGIRYRVSNLFDTTSILLLTGPKEHGWEVIRLFIRVTDEKGSKDEAIERVSEMNFWLVCRQIGSFDIYAVATVKSNREADAIVSDVRGLDCVSQVEEAIETDRITSIDHYLDF